MAASLAAITLLLISFCCHIQIAVWSCKQVLDSQAWAPSKTSLVCHSPAPKATFLDVFLVDLNICGFYWTQSSSNLTVVLVVSRELTSELECLNDFYLALRHGQWLAELGGNILVSAEFFLLLDICLPSHVALKPIRLSLCLYFICGIVERAHYRQAQV